MNCLDMPRVRKTFVLDERVMNALDSAAKKAGYKNANQFVEATLFNLLKLSGNLDADAEPLTEARGGKREGAGKPKRSPETTVTADDAIAPDLDAE
jgi:hypothetical protein